jgi:hypothetical protein
MYLLPLHSTARPSGRNRSLARELLQIFDPSGNIQWFDVRANTVRRGLRGILQIRQQGQCRPSIPYLDEALGATMRTRRGSLRNDRGINHAECRVPSGMAILALLLKLYIAHDPASCSRQIPSFTVPTRSQLLKLPHEGQIVRVHSSLVFASFVVPVHWQLSHLQMYRVTTRPPAARHPEERRTAILYDLGFGHIPDTFLCGEQNSGYRHRW